MQKEEGLHLTFRDEEEVWQRKDHRLWGQRPQLKSSQQLPTERYKTSPLNNLGL